jgi:DNA-directed RNA polymerase subunit M/transcription elongation factor TFIIS
MEKAYCPHCETLLEFDAEVRWKNVDCPACGKEFMVDPTFEPPPLPMPFTPPGSIDSVSEAILEIHKTPIKTSSSKITCVLCQGTLVPISEPKNEGVGCIIILIGLIFSPMLFGIPVVIIGIYYMTRKTRSYQCQSCGNKIPK